jgi:hypothetical protein
MLSNPVSVLVFIIFVFLWIYQADKSLKVLASAECLSKKRKELIRSFSFAVSLFLFVVIFFQMGLKLLLIYFGLASLLLGIILFFLRKEIKIKEKLLTGIFVIISFFAILLLYDILHILNESREGVILKFMFWNWQ